MVLAELVTKRSTTYRTLAPIDALIELLQGDESKGGANSGRPDGADFEDVRSFVTLLLHSASVGVA